MSDPAERLRAVLADEIDPTGAELLDQALAEGRRATVERIRAAVYASPAGEWNPLDSTAILDAEAGRE